MDNHAFVDSVIKEIVQPGVDALMKTRYFAELGEGKLSKQRLQGFAIQHYLHNVALCKGLVLCMIKYISISLLLSLLVLAGCSVSAGIG